MKKKTALCLILVLVLTLSACGGEPQGGTVTPPETTAPAAPTGTIAPVETTAPAETTMPVETTLPAEENPLSLGRIDGGVYSNEYAGFSCSLDANWTFYSAEELQQLPSTVADAMEGSELGDALANVTQFTDMMAENTTDLTSMNVLYQKLSMQERLAYTMLSEEDIANSTLAQKDTIAEAYATAGMTLLSMEKVTVTFLGESHTAIASSLTIQEIPYYTLQLFDYHLGEYAVTLTLASYVEDNTASLLELFTPIS